MAENKTKSFSSFADLFKSEYSGDYNKSTFERWKIFLHLLSSKHEKKHDKFKLLSLVKIVESELWFLAITSDKLSAKTVRITKGEAVEIPEKTTNCLSTKSIIDANDLELIKLEKAHQLSRTKPKGYKKIERLIDKNEKLPQQYQELVMLACTKTNPVNTKHLAVLKEIAGQPVMPSTNNNILGSYL